MFKEWIRVKVLVAKSSVCMVTNGIGGPDAQLSSTALYIKAPACDTFCALHLASPSRTKERYKYLRVCVSRPHSQFARNHTVNSKINIEWRKFHCTFVFWCYTCPALSRAPVTLARVIPSTGLYSQRWWVTLSVVGTRHAAAHYITLQHTSVQCNKGDLHITVLHWGHSCNWRVRLC